MQVGVNIYFVKIVRKGNNLYYKYHKATVNTWVGI